MTGLIFFERRTYGRWCGGYCLRHKHTFKLYGVFLFHEISLGFFQSDLQDKTNIQHFSSSYFLGTLPSSPSHLVETPPLLFLKKDDTLNSYISEEAYSGALILVPSLSLQQKSSSIWTPGYGEAPDRQTTWFVICYLHKGANTVQLNNYIWILDVRKWSLWIN